MAAEGSTTHGAREPGWARALSFCAILLALLAAAAVAVCAAVGTAEVSVSGAQFAEAAQGSFIGDFSAVSVIALVLAAVAEAVLLVAVSRLVGRFSAGAVIAVSCVGALLVQVAWIALVGTGSADTRQAQWQVYLAQALVAGDASAFTQTVSASQTYLSLHPFQAGTVLYFAGILSLFGSGNIIALQVANALFNVLAVGSLAAVCYQLFDDRTMPVLLAVFAGCLPLCFSSVLLEGMPAGAGLACAALALAVCALRRGGAARIACTIGASVLFAGSLAVAPYLAPVGIVAVVVWLLEALSSRSWTYAVAVLVCAVLAAGAPLYAAAGIEDAMGVEISASQSQVLQNAFDGAGRNAAQVAGGAEGLLGALSAEWADPSFQTLYYASSGLGDGGGVAAAVISSESPLHVGTMVFLDCYQFIVCLCAAVGFARILADKGRWSWPWALVPAVFAAAFIALALVSAEAVCALPYFMLLLPFAAYGLQPLAAR